MTRGDVRRITNRFFEKLEREYGVLVEKKDKDSLVIDLQGMC